MAFSRQEYWSGLPFPFPEYLPDPGIEVTSSALADRFFTTESPGKPILSSTDELFFKSEFYYVMTGLSWWLRR